MSKLYEISKIYGQDFGIAVTNAPSKEVKKSHNLFKNVLLIASPQAGWDGDDPQDEDEGTAALFATDYEGNPVQLTYPVKTGENGSGLAIDDDGCLTIKIDETTIKSKETLDDGTVLKGLPLFVDTTNLTFARLNDLSNRGVVNVADYIPLSRELSDLNENDNKKSISGISITNDGCLYISESFVNRLLQYVQLSIEDKIKPLAKENMNATVTIDDESLILYTGVNPYQTEAIGTKSENGYYNIKKMTLNFVSENDKPIEGISLPVVSGNMIIKIDGKDSATSEVDTEKPYLVLGDYKQYNHTIKNIEAVIYPNYNIINNQFIPATNAFKIEGIKELDNTVREYPSVSFTQAAMESNSDTGFLFKIVNNVALNLNYTIESNVITVSMDGSININYRGLYSYTNQDKRYEPISYKYKIFIGPQEIYDGTIEPNKDLNTKSISIGYSDITDQNLGALDVIKNSCVRDNTGQIQILGSSATYNKLYAILYISLPGQEAYEYKSNNITVNHKNIGNYKNVVFKYAASSYMSGSTLSSSLETHALSLNSGNDEFVQYVINHISGGKVNLTLSFRYTGEQYNLEGKNDIGSLLFTAQNGDETILFENSNTDQGQITGEGTIITLKSSNYFIDKNYIVKTTFSTDKPNFSTDSDFTFNLQEVILNRLNNAVKICSTSNNSGVYYTEGKQITNQYVYISKTLTYGSKTLTVNISGNNTGLEVSEENGYHKIKVTPEPQNIELLLQTDGSNFTITKELPVYKLGTISNIEFATEPISKGDNKYQINYTIIYSGTDTGGHIPETVTFSPDNVATLENINQRNANSGYINIQVNSNELCTLTFTVRGNNYITKSIDYNFGTITEPVNTKILQSFTMSVNGITKDDGDDATINLTNGGILLINPTPSTTDELFNVTTKSEHLRITEDPNHDNQYILTGIDETGTTDKAQVTVEPVKYNIASKTINIEVVESGGESGVQLNSISWTPNVGTNTITNNASNATIVGKISINPATASSYNFEITFKRNGSIISSGITATINSNREISVQSSLLYSTFGTGTSIDVIMTVTPTGYVASDIQGISKTITINKEASSGEVNDLTSFDFSNTDNPIEIERTKYKTLTLKLNPTNSTVSFDWTTESTDITLTPTLDTHSCKVTANSITSTPATITVTPVGTFEGVTAKTKQISVIPLNGGVKSIEWNSPVTSSGLSVVRNQTVTISVNKINCESSNLVWDYSPNNTVLESIITMSNKTNSSCDITGNSLTTTSSAVIIRCSLADDSSVYAELPITVVSGDESNDPNELTVETGVATYARYFKSTDNGTTYTELNKINSNYILGVEKGTSVKLKAKLYTSNDEYILSHSINWTLTCENNNFILLGNLLNPCTVTASENTGILSGTITVDYGLTDTISVSSRTLTPLDPITPEPDNPEEPETLDLIPCFITSDGSICARKLSHDTNVLNDYTLSGNAFFSIKSNGYDLSKVNVDIPERTNLTVLPIDNYGYFCKRYYSYNYWPAGTSGLDTNLHDCTFNYNNDSEYLKLRYRAIYDEDNTMFLDGNFYNYFARIPSCGVSNKTIHISLYPYIFDHEYFEFTSDNLEMYLLILDDNNGFNSYKFNNSTKIFVSQNSNNNDIPLNETMFSSLNITISGLDIYINYSISQNIQTDYKNAILTIEGTLIEFLQEYHNTNRIYFTNSLVNDYLYDNNDPNFNKFCQCGSKIITKDYTIDVSSNTFITSNIYNSVMYPSVLENTFNITRENVTNSDTVLSWDNLEYKTCMLLNSDSKIIFTKK